MAIRVVEFSNGGYKIKMIEKVSDFESQILAHFDNFPINPILKIQ